MDKIRISYSFPVDLFGGWSFRCLYFDSISEVIDFYFQHPEATSFEITILLIQYQIHAIRPLSAGIYLLQ